MSFDYFQYRHFGRKFMAFLNYLEISTSNSSVQLPVLLWIRITNIPIKSTFSWIITPEPVELGLKSISTKLQQDMTKRTGMHCISRPDGTQHTTIEKNTLHGLSIAKSQSTQIICKEYGLLYLEYYPSEPLGTAMANDGTVIGYTMK